MTIYTCCKPMSVSGVSDICFKCFIWICCYGYTHMFQTYVLSVSDASHLLCCKCFIWILQSGSRCCIYMHVYMHVASVCFKCFIRLLQVFYLDVAYVCNGFLVFSGVFASVSLSSFVCYNNYIWMF